MLAVSVLTSGSSAIEMKEQLEVQSPARTDTSTSTSPSATPPPVAVNRATVAQQYSTEATGSTVPRNARGERDSSWLELEVCREYLRQMCPRQAQECRYAHPEPRIYVKDGRVTCCYDSLKVNQLSASLVKQSVHTCIPLYSS